MGKQTDWKQQRFLADLEKGEKAVDLIFQDYDIPPKELTRWLKSAKFMRHIAELRERSSFKFDMDLMRAALVGAQRIYKTAVGGAGIASPREFQAAYNAVRLFRAVQNAEVRRLGKAQARSIREHDDSWLGYNARNTPERAAALLRRIQKEEARANRTELGQTEDGHWEPLD
jgi:hypothetical protein